MRKIAIALTAFTAIATGAHAADFASNAVILDAPAGCTCTEGAKTWACRKLVDNWSTSPPVLSCPENRKASCRWRQPYVPGFLMICIEQDKPR
jgi:hypothetical protein